MPAVLRCAWVAELNNLLPECPRGFRTRTWPIETLTSDWHEIEGRMRLTAHLSELLASIPKTDFFITEDAVIQFQERQRKQSIRGASTEHLTQSLEQLAHDLDRVVTLGWVHGDINRRNVIWDGRQLWLVDLEPDLYQIRDGRNAMMATAPWIAHEDWLNQRLTVSTDKLGFAVLCRLLLPFPPLQINRFDIWTRRRAGDAALPWGFTDASLSQLSFAEIWLEAREDLAKIDANS